MVQSTGAQELAPPPVREPLPTRLAGLPPLPDEYDRILRAGLPALPALAADGLPEGWRDAVDGHIRLLVAWNEAINLSGIREPAAMAREHVLDSLTAVGPIRRAGIDEFVDLGSGAGFPGLPLAAALPARRALLVESIAKKARFLETAVRALGLGDRVGVVAERAETIAADRRHRGRWQAVVARALADLTEVAELGLPLLSEGGLLIAWKRVPFDEELAIARAAVPRLGGRLAACESVTVTGLEDHVLAMIEKVGPTPAEFPRSPAARRRRPLGG